MGFPFSGFANAASVHHPSAQDQPKMSMLAMAAPSPHSGFKREYPWDGVRSVEYGTRHRTESERVALPSIHQAFPEIHLRVQSQDTAPKSDMSSANSPTAGAPSVMTPPDYVHSPTSNKRRRLSVEAEEERERSGRAHHRLYEIATTAPQHQPPPPSRPAADKWATSTRTSPYVASAPVPPIRTSAALEVHERSDSRPNLPSLPPLNNFDREPLHGQRPRGQSSEEFQPAHLAPVGSVAQPPAMESRPPYPPESAYGFHYHHPTRAQSLSVGAVPPYNRATYPNGGYGPPHYHSTDYMRIGELGGAGMGMHGENKHRKRRGNLPKETTDKLRSWFMAHLQHPYPTEDEKQELMRQTGLQMNPFTQKRTGWHLKPVFDTRLKAKPFYKENYDASVVKLSKLYDMVRTRGNPVKGDSAAGGTQGSFVRNTTKYWVHPDNVTELKLIILKHLPVLVFNASKEFEAQDSAITSIYYDNPDKWDLYEGRLKKSEGAEAIRLRWYGGMQSENIFVERKTHREDWTGEKSVKARFSLKEKNVNSYMRGELLPAAIFEKARKEGKKPKKQIDEDERLAAEVQYSCLKKGYKPVCRSFYNRTAFQLPADARVRISLDTELTMVREDNLDGSQRSGDNWRRLDIGVDYPFSQLPPKDVERFPYAVLEVKLQTQLGQEPPEWVRQLISSHLVEAVPKFSKFIHGVATLFPERIHLLPFWMPQMDVDIRKPATHDFGIQRGVHSAGTTTSDDDEEDDDLDSDDEEVSAEPSTRAVAHDRTTNGESSAQAAATRSRTADGGGIDIEDQTTDAVVAGVNEDYLYDSDEEYDESDRLEEAKRIGGWTYYSTLAKTKGAALGRHAVEVAKWVVPHPRGSEIPRREVQTQLFGSGEIQTKKFKAPKGKKIYVPVRVEPKVFFAAERTFLGWLEYSIYVGTVAVTLLNFGGTPTATSFIVAGIFTLLAILSLCYSVGIYLYRSSAIRNRRNVKFYDRVGPSILAVALFVAVALNFGFEGRERQYW